MKITGDTKKLLLSINDFSGNQIKNQYEVSVLIELASSPGNKKKFEDLIFTSKYVIGLKNILSSKSITGNEYIEKIFDEFKKQLQKTIDLLNDLTGTAEANIYKHFSDKYLGMDQESIVNVMSLTEDLSFCKEFFNANPDVSESMHL